MKIKKYAMSVNLAIFYREISATKILLKSVLFQGTNITAECVKRTMLMKTENVLKITKN